MSRSWLFVALLLTIGVALAADPPEAEPASGATDAQAGPAAETGSGTPGQAGTGAPAEADTGARADAETGALTENQNGAAPAVPSEAEAGAQANAEGDTQAATGTGAQGDAQKEGGAKTISGMSILGNQEAPKALVIVPWKSSEIGDSLGISTMLDDSKRPVDKEVFMRELSYYEIRSDLTSRTGSGPAEVDYQ